MPHRAVRVEDRSKDAYCKDVGLEQMQPRRTVRGSVDEGVDRLIESRVNL